MSLLTAGLVLAICAAAVFLYDYFWRDRAHRAFERRLRDPQIREWRAHSPSGMVPLGKCSYDTALARASKLGKISYVDEANGLMFYDTHLGGPPPEGDRNSGV